MTCFLCGRPARPQVVRTLSSSWGPRGWARVCVPCAIAHEIEGVLLAGPRDREMADRWRAHRSEDA